jgi:hypothetical protein
MRNATECIEEAERCERNAAACSNEGLRDKLEKIAATWREMARDAKEREHASIHTKVTPSASGSMSASAGRATR